MSKKLYVLLALVVVVAMIAAHFITKWSREEPAPEAEAVCPEMCATGHHDPLYYLPDGSRRAGAWEVVRVDTVGIKQVVTPRENWYGNVVCIDTSYQPILDTTFGPVSPWKQPEYDPLYWTLDRFGCQARRPEAWAVDSLVMTGCEKQPMHDSIGRMEPTGFTMSWGTLNGGWETKADSAWVIDLIWVDTYDTIWKPRKVVFE